MSTRLRILNVEDSASDAELMRRPFETAGYELVWERVETAQEMRDALARQEWDAVLSDYIMPGFDALSALDIFRERGLDIPFIVVSGAIGEELGVSMMKAGAHDYVLKHHLGRLLPAVERELREGQIRRDRRAAQQRLCQSEQRFRELAEVMPQLVWQTDAEGRMEYANGAWSEYFERDIGACPAPWLDFTHPDDRMRVLRSWASRGSGDGEDRTESTQLRMRREDGAYHWFISRRSAVRAANGEILHWVGTLTDIQTLKQDAEALRRANANLQQFAYSAAHDLLEPLRNITTLLTLLSRMEQIQLNEEARELISTAIGDAQRLRGMLRGLYDLTRVDPEVTRNPCADANHALRQVLDTLRTASAEAGAQVTSDALPCVAIAEVHLVQLLQNLIANSLKFRTGIRPLRIHITAERRDSEWLFSIEDNGTGFDPSQSERIFEPFRRLDPVHTEGTGVGLALCARIVTSYGGHIWAEGRPGEGATFRFTLLSEQAYRNAA